MHPFFPPSEAKILVSPFKENWKVKCSRWKWSTMNTKLDGTALGALCRAAWGEAGRKQMESRSRVCGQPCSLRGHEPLKDQEPRLRHV